MELGAVFKEINIKRWNKGISEQDPTKFPACEPGFKENLRSGCGGTKH